SERFVRRASAEGPRLPPLTPRGVLELRQLGLLSKLRDDLRDADLMLRATDKATVSAAAERAVDRFANRIEEAAAEVRSLAEDRRDLFASKIPQAAGSVGLSLLASIAGAYGGAPAIVGAAVSALAGASGLSSLKDVSGGFASARERKRRLASSPYAILLRAGSA
ncbi:MAG TPA: hypothetical protein VFF65_12560, partial [Phycisphaerales bacterium]|nr:hypothetical protein [Phycisphaerales bacterium]